MPVVYKLDVLAALKAQGYSTYRLRKEKLLAEGVLQSFRTGGMVSLDNIARVCALLDCQPGDLLAYVPEAEDSAGG